MLIRKKKKKKKKATQKRGYLVDVKPISAFDRIHNSKTRKNRTMENGSS